VEQQRNHSWLEDNPELIGEEKVKTEYLRCALFDDRDKGEKAGIKLVNLT
jgi:hypothetical protein